MTLKPFGERLQAAMAERGPLCVGIDPHPSLLRAWGLGDDVVGLERFSRTVVDALADRVAVVKPQSAFFERFGSRGVAVLETVISSARAAGALVLVDVKRGDIGTTMAAYGESYVDQNSPLASDAMTVSPYLGVGALEAVFDLALTHGAGVFVLALTSNPEARPLQHARFAPDVTVAQHVLNEVGEYNRRTLSMLSTTVNSSSSEPTLGSIGVVVGATTGTTGHTISGVGGPFLAPGIGAQGATAADLAIVFGGQLRAVLPTVSRTVLQAGPEMAALRKAAMEETAACALALGHSPSEA